MKLYYCRLAKLYKQNGQKAKVRERYERFLTLWKDAYPVFPELADTRKRYAGLK